TLPSFLCFLISFSLNHNRVASPPRDSQPWELRKNCLLKIRHPFVTVAEVFQFADKYRRSYNNALKPFVCPFYCCYSGYQDELLWGAAWLHKATKNPMYLNYIKVNGQILGVVEFDNTFGWDNKHVGARILLSKEFFVQRV
ncbi:endoglucanase 17-like, partial [Vigna unguiculata]|uniref:endoglucanase 17-like n=1 Tax=Vigna unguiculata TaxID=3917 RepID=UPI00101705B1